MKKTVGVLGLQGDFALHRNSLKKIGADVEIVRWPEELENCDGLIIPGGESTTFLKLLRETGLFEAIQHFAKERAVMGTCAGLISMASRVSNDNIETLDIIDMEVERNAYGRQVNSFIDKINIPGFSNKSEFEGIFIRAPKILSMGEHTEALGFHQNNVVLARNEHVLVMTFHPELTKDTRIHKYFVDVFVKN
jgi:5'-phosphate synthase pdxT subunit